MDNVSVMENQPFVCVSKAKTFVFESSSFNLLVFIGPSQLEDANTG
jgi:hypothetical protein